MGPNSLPRFLITSNRGILPSIPLPENYQRLLPAFYEAGCKERIEKYAELIGKQTGGVFGPNEIRLGWNEKGLAHISATPSSGLDLNDNDEFQEHNLGGDISLIVGAVALEYVNYLLNPHAPSGRED